MYENRYLQITTQGSQFYLNIRDYYIHKDFFSTIIENMFSFSGSKVNHAKNNVLVTLRIYGSPNFNFYLFSRWENKQK